MAGSAVSENEHRTDRRCELVADGETFEAVVLDEFFTGLDGIIALRVRVDNARGDERFFYVAPAPRFGTGVRAFLGDRSRFAQARVEAGINLRIRMND